MILRTDLPLIGVGAPIHVFLPKVARLLGTRAVLHQYSAVANALGAVASQVITHVTVRVHADYIGSTPDGFSVMDGEKKVKFEHYKEALEYARDLAGKLVYDKAVKSGASASPAIEVREEEIKSGRPPVFFETLVEGIAKDSFFI